MKRFADAFYFLALLNRNDRAHAAAKAISAGPGIVITTEWVIVEVADAMAPRSMRSQFCRLNRALRTDSRVGIQPASPE